MAVGSLSSLVRSYAVAAPGANTNILTTGITPKMDGVFIVTVCLTTGSVFNITTTDGTTSYTNNLNAGVALTAAAMYTFCFGVITSLTYNFQVATNGVIRILHVDHATDAVATNSAQGA